MRYPSAPFANKVAPLALSLAMTGSLLAACSGKGEQTTQASTAPSASASASPSASAQPTSKPEKKQLDISMSISGFTAFGKDPIGQKIAQDLKINIVPVPSDLDQLKLKAAAGEFPDVAIIDAADDLNLLYQWIDQGIIRKVPAAMAAPYSTLKKVFDSSEIHKTITKIKGDSYYIPRAYSFKNYYKAAWQGIYYRKDWMANVGIAKAPTTVDELYAMFKAFSTGDPDKNGKNDTYGLLLHPTMDTGFYVFGIDPNVWVEQNGKYVPTYVTNEMLEPLKFYRKLFAEKILDPEFAQSTPTLMLQKLSSGTFGAMARNMDSYWIYNTINNQFGNANKDKGDPLNLLGILPPIKLNGQDKARAPLAVQEGAAIIGAKVSDEKLDRIMELIEYLKKPELYALMRYGVEGTDYKKNGDKREYMTNPDTGKPYTFSDMLKKYPSASIINLPDYGFDAYIEDDLLPQGYKDLAKQVRDEKNAVVTNPNLTPQFLSTPAKDSLRVNVSEEMVKIVMGNEDVEAMFKRFVDDSMNRGGLSKAIDEVTAKMKAIK